MKIRQIVAGVVLALGVQGAVMANSMPSPSIERDVVAYAFEGVEAQQLSALSGTEMAETQGAFFGMMMGMMGNMMGSMMAPMMQGMMQSPMGSVMQQGMSMMMQPMMQQMMQQMGGMMQQGQQQQQSSNPYRRR